MTAPFALWMTGLPSSGKSSITAALLKLLHKRSVDPVVLESDVFRKYFTPHATYSEDERVLFYQGIVLVAEGYVEHGVPVIIDATGNRREYRDLARKRLPVFAEVFVDCPLEVCKGRDPKGIYRKAQEGSSSTVPGLQSEYEPPLQADIHVRSDREDPESAAKRILDFMIASEWIPSRKLYRV
ncbi:MAG TPA: adenylyl-sulfate kinase [Planctomycetota bacterium]|nr:adenylyl-sulfate kinase [Planctomycetota bacterium]